MKIKTLNKFCVPKSDSKNDLAAALDYAETLLGITRRLAMHDDLDQMLETLMEIITTEVDATRCTIFLKDTETDELYSRVATGTIKREIRMLEKIGIAGHVYTTGEALIVPDAYADNRFNPKIDEKTGFKTKNIICVPIKTIKGEVIGVSQALNKKNEGEFLEEDLEIMGAVTTQAAVTLQTTQVVEKMKKSRKQEMEFFDVVSDVISELDLATILNKVMSQATKMLDSERSTLFLNDEKTNELFSHVGEGLGVQQIRLSNHLGIAGAVFTSRETINIPYAYADLRFNPAFDKKTGFFTRSILCVPVVNKKGKTIGVTQVLNKRGGPFTDDDEFRLKTFTAQVSIALENAQLFDEMQNMKNYSEGMLESMTNGVITLNENGTIITCNDAGLQIMRISSNDIINRQVDQFFTEKNVWILEKIKQVDATRETETTMDAILEFGGEKISVNTTILTHIDAKKKRLGTMIMVEDISNEKRLKSTMSRYMDPGLADQLLSGNEGEDILGGKSVVATVLFSDIRGFTTLTEELGAQGTVKLLNDYFSIMVECIQEEDGMLDKFIGDAIMAAFGIPIAHNDDEDKAVRASINMISELFAWNNQRLGHGKKPVDMGIGINTDEIVTGNIGSPKRMDYTMIGDGVNLASRLESACKQYSARILISENTFKKLRGTYRTREVDKVVVKGKTEPVSIFEVMDYHNDITFPNLMEVLNYFRNGLALYRSQKWDRSIKAFNEALALNPHDNVAQMYVDRARVFKDNPPGEEWNGVWVMTKK